jgi:hypothetical protein
MCTAVSSASTRKPSESPEWYSIEPFWWTEEEEKDFAALKLLLTHALVVQDWNWEFNVFVDASDIAIGNVLMQKYKKNWFLPVYYASR